MGLPLSIGSQRQAFLFRGKNKEKGLKAIDRRIKWHIGSGDPPKYSAAP